MQRSVTFINCMHSSVKIYTVHKHRKGKKILVASKAMPCEKEQPVDTAFKMAVSSLKSYDETTSCRSNDDVINMTKSATTAGDNFFNSGLDENYNNNNRKSCLVNTKSEKISSPKEDTTLQKNDQEQRADLPSEEQWANQATQDNIIADIPNKFSESNKNSETMKVEVNCDITEANENLKTDISVENIGSENGNNENMQVATQSGLNQQSQSPSSHPIREDDDQSLAAEEEVVRDPEWVEDRFRVDRRKLEQMLQAAANGTGQSGEEFFAKVMSESNTQISWPSKLKIGAKSKKDPHIKVSGKQENVKKAKALVMQVLDTKCSRVTLKMDVSHTEHSHVIGKGGNNIKRVMEETGCHIHFPDSNKNSPAEKSNQVSIAGLPVGVESARSKIRELLPIVLTFDLSMSGTIPDPNSPPIQHIVQTYNISVQFKQRMKVYCTTTCTVRGSNDNVSGLVEGTMKLMQITGGQAVRVTSQMEVAPQQHSYMLGRNAINVNQIMQKTGAQITFPDPNCVPKKSTIFITGNVEQVVHARRRLMGCLPLVLMFDMKQEEGTNNDDSALNSHLMESLDVFISIKQKPKQPSKSVIVKSVEKNIFNMFEARRRLLKLATTGLQTPSPPSSSPPMSIPTTSSMTETPMIRLTQPQVNKYISIIPPNGVALVNGAMNPLSRSSTPTATAVLRSNWPHSPMPSPSQSPFPISQQATVAALHVQQQQQILLQAQLNAQQHQQQQQMASLVLASASQASSMAGSPPINQKTDDPPRAVQPDPLRITQQFIHENNLSKRSNQQHQNGNLQLPRANSTNSPPFESARSNITDWGASPEPEASAPRSTYYPDNQEIPGNVRNLQRHLMAVQSQMGRLSANSSFNNGNGGKHMVHSHSFSDSTVHRDELPTANRLQRHSIADGVDAPTRKFLEVANNHKRGPMSLHSTPPGSDRNSPLSAMDYQVLSPDNDLNKLPGKIMKSPSSSASSTDLQAALRNLHNSPSRAQFLHPDRLKEQQRGRLENSFQGSFDMRDPDRHGDDYFKGSSPAPPPGFDRFPLPAQSPLAESNYEAMRQKAYEAMQNNPVASEIRKPTNIWFGQGFSRSMPSHEWNRLDINKKSFNRLDTNYERDDVTLPEDTESSESNHLASSQHLANSSKGGSALSAWREKNSHNLSLHSKDLGNSLPQRRHHATFDPSPNDYMNQTLPPPPHPNDDTNNSNSYGNPGDSMSRLQHISNQPLEAALSLLTNNHLGGQSNSVELHDLLSHLNLQRYSEVFSNQEVDLQTFLTLTESDLTELGIKAFGPRKKILLAIEKLKKNRNVLYGEGANTPSSISPSLRLPQQSSDSLSGFLSPQPRPQSPTNRPQAPVSHLPASRLLHGGKGMVNQSGRW